MWDGLAALSPIECPGNTRRRVPTLEGRWASTPLHSTPVVLKALRSQRSQG
jgi:hypothetical protein